MPTVDVLLHGESIATNYGSIGYCSTLLVRGDRNIVVDTGHVGRRALPCSRRCRSAVSVRPTSISR